MFKRKVKISPQSSVTAGQTVTYVLPTERRYHGLLFNYQESGADANQANTETDITEVRIYINDKLVRQASARQIIDMYSFYGHAFVTGFLQIFFAEPWRRNAANEELLAWSMGGVSSFRVELDIVSGATSPAIPNAYAIVDQPVLDNGQLPRLGLVNQWVKRNVGVTSTGDKEVTDLPKDMGRYSAIHCQEGSAGDITHVKVETDQLVLIDMDDEDLEQSYEMANPDYSPVSDNTVIKFDDSGILTDSLSMVKANGQKVSDYKVTATMGNATDFVMLCEILGNVI